MWIQLGGKWRRLPARRAAVWQALVSLVKEQLAGLDSHGPPPPLSDFRYATEPVAKSGPRRGYVDDRFLPWWKLPQDSEGRRIGDCEDLSTAFVARAVAAEGLRAVPVVERIAGSGFHALAALVDPEHGQILPRGRYYAGPGQDRLPLVIVDPSYLRGMPDPRQRPRCFGPARAEGLCR